MSIGMKLGIGRALMMKAEERRQKELIEEERAYERENYMMQLAEKRRDNLLGLFAKRSVEDAGGKVIAGKAQKFFDRVGDVDDPRVAALLKDPATAAALEDKINDIEIERAKNDLDLPPLSGQALLDLLTVQIPETGAVKPVDLTLDDILTMDMTDRAAYERQMIELSQPRGRVYADISPEAYRKADPKTLEPGRLAFDQEILRLANKALADVADDANESANLTALIEGFKTEGSAERFALMDMFGHTAFENLATTENPYIQNIQEDPLLSRYAIKRISSDAEYEALPSGAAFYGPDGKLRRKP